MGISIKRVSDEMLSFLQKNRIILDYPSVKSRDNRVNLHYYFADEGLAEKNLGDYLSIVVVDWMLRKEGMSLDTCIQGKKHLYAIGSIILMGYQNCTIWGTGFPFAPSLLRGLPHRYPFRKLDVRSVRGPRTRDVMLALGHSAPKIYGDPAILMPYIYTPTYREKKTDYVVIPHFSTEQAVQVLIGKENIISMNTNDYKSVVDRICSAKRVISSSLHGIILAESYGVPAIFYQDRSDRFNFKYDDWYQSTGRELKAYDNLMDAINAEPRLVPNLHDMQERLINVFPYDIWKGGKL